MSIHYKYFLAQQIFMIRCAQLLWLTSTKTADAFCPARPLNKPLLLDASYPVFGAAQRRGITSPKATTALLAAPSTAPSTILSFDSAMDDVSQFSSTVVIGKKSAMEAAFPNLLEPLGLQGRLSTPVLNTMLRTIQASGGTSTTLVGLSANDRVHKVSLAGLPTKISRNNHPMSVNSLTQIARNMAGSDDHGDTRIVVLAENHPIGPLASAIAKAFPLFSLKTNKKNPQDAAASRQVKVVFCRADGTLVQDTAQLNAAQAVAAGVQLATRLVDMHPELLTTTQFAKEVEDLVGKHPKVKMTQMVGDELMAYGGLYGVGKAATCPPRMIILEYNGGGQETIALVGKGIVYDTGGLSLKGKEALCGMKYDMGGAAAVLGGFWSAVQLGTPKHVYAILCIADNAIGSKAFRPDDILTMYSGKTVEVNNCDAEGRLVVADGVAHATKHFANLDLVVDIATLTGAQRIAIGKKHAGILANRDDVERRAMTAGMHSGDLCFPLLYAPELLMEEFKSEVADMKNSVKDRNNAQSSCAGHFIEAHLDESYQGGWLHVDMAGPGRSTVDQRGSGFGVGLVLSLLEAPGF